MKYITVSDDWYDYPKNIPVDNQEVLVEAGDNYIIQSAIFSDDCFKSNGIKIEKVHRWKPNNPAPDNKL